VYHKITSYQPSTNGKDWFTLKSKKVGVLFNTDSDRKNRDWIIIIIILIIIMYYWVKSPVLKEAVIRDLRSRVSRMWRLIVR
jgi:hypothetical protein